MRLIGAASILFVAAMAFALSGFAPATTAAQQTSSPGGGQHQPLDGQAIFRFDTFGDEQLWTDVLRMHEVLATVVPATALAVGLKVDVEALPRADRRRAAGRRGRSQRSGGHGRAAPAECGRRRQGHGQRIQDS